MLTLRHARMDELAKIHRWLCHADTTSMHMGPPDYPENPILTLEDFKHDFEPFYFNPSEWNKGGVCVIENNGRELGCVCQARFHLAPATAELDIWLREKRLCGQGLGPEALRLMMRRLMSDGVSQFLIRPSTKNLRARKAYEKIGFLRVPKENKHAALKRLLKPEYLDAYGAGDYGFTHTEVMTAP